jgi:integrase
MKDRRPKPWPEINRQERTRYVWRFDGQKYRTPYYDDPEEARADATTQITELLQGTWRDRSGPRMPLEEWIDVWAGMLGDIEPTTVAKYKYFVEGHILPQFQGRQLGSLTFEEIEQWEAGITKRISERGRPFAPSVAVSARSLLITILGDAVHAKNIDWNPADAPLHLVKDGISTYAVDWQLRELGGTVRKSAPKDGSYRVLDLPPFLAGLMQWAVDNRPDNCSCPQVDGRLACKGEDPTPASYLFLGPKGGHLRRSNYADGFLTPAAEGLHPARNGTRRPVYVNSEPWPGIPIRRTAKAAVRADGTWPNLTGHLKPHDYRHTHATWLEDAGLSKVIQMDRRGHAMPGMDRVYTHVTTEMRQRLCAVLEDLWQNALQERQTISPRSNVPLLGRALSERQGQPEEDLAPQSAPQRPRRTPSREAEP